MSDVPHGEIPPEIPKPRFHPCDDCGGEVFLVRIRVSTGYAGRSDQRQDGEVICDGCGHSQEIPS